MTGDEDKKTTDDWKADADGILIFVSRHSTSGTYGHQSSPQRLVHPLPLSRHWLQCPCRISSRTLRIPQHFTLQTSISSSPIRRAPTSLSPPSFLIRPRHLLCQTLPGGSTRSGSSV